ncbi:MAG TPA: CHAT domain-containing protein [Actinospica sp.]|jgi:hypothetical protein|nr:CHAT domain-containing protein [Actinospica sp.]
MDADDPASAFARCLAMLDFLADNEGTHEQYRQLFADLGRIPREWPEREELAERMAKLSLPAANALFNEYLKRGSNMVDVADATNGPSLVDEFGLLVFTLASALWAGPEKYDTSGSRTLVDFAHRHATADDDNEIWAELMAICLRYAGVDPGADRWTLRAIADEARDLSRRLSLRPRTPATAFAVDYTNLLADYAESDEQAALTGTQDDGAALAAQLRRHAELIDRLPAGALRPEIVEEITRASTALLEEFERVRAGSPVDSEVTASTKFSEAEAAEGIAHVSAMSAGDDPVALDGAVRDIQHAIDVANRVGGPSPELLKIAGATYLFRGIARDCRPDFDLSIEYCERAIAATASHLRADSSELHQVLAVACWWSGRHGEAVDATLRGLTGFAWLALIQNDAPDVHSVIRKAAAYALMAARSLTPYEDAASAARILEAGRALIVFAARQTDNIATRLREIGEAGLADEWNRAVASVGVESIPARLRVRAFCALAGVPIDSDGSTEADILQAARKLVNPPKIPQIQAALRELDQDALIYLAPGEGTQQGFAIVVGAHSDPIRLTLPDLDTARAEAFEDVVHSLSRAARDLDAAGTTARDADASVTALCDWAWRAAMDQILGYLWETGLPDRVTRQYPPRPVRLVLVPMGELALIPWHAARNDFGEVDGTYLGVRHAIHFAAFSYAASARVLCDVAARRPVPISDAGLVIGDPDARGERRDLHAAREEAVSIIESFYPDGRYLGRLPDGTRSPDGAGTKREVLDWLADPDGGPVLHLACHGSTPAGTGRVETSFVLLEGGARLSAEELVNSLRADAGHDIALAVLAACSTAQSGRGYDEAFNLGTVLLSHGVRSVVSAQWPVPDEDTSVLMYMFHFFLREAGMSPGDALCAAQLWMLENGEPPPCMPWELRDRARATAASGGIASWAGFVHAGR